MIIFRHADMDGDELSVETAHGGGFAVIATDSTGLRQVVVNLDEAAAVALLDAVQAAAMPHTGIPT